MTNVTTVIALIARIALLPLLWAGCDTHGKNHSETPDAAPATAHDAEADDGLQDASIMDADDVVDAADLADAIEPSDAKATIDGGQPAVGSAPRWFLDAPERVWTEVAAGAARSDLPASQRGTRITDVAPMPAPPGNSGLAAVTGAWTGATTLQRRGEYIIPAQGGHSDYYGNEIYALALRDSTPGWKRIWGPTPNAQISTSEFTRNQAYTAYADGSPRTSHGWYHVQASEQDERIWLPFVNACPSGLWTTETYSIARNDLAVGWTYHGRLWTDVGLSNDFYIQTGPATYDPATNTLWQAAEGSNIAPFLMKVDVAQAVAAGRQQPQGNQVPGSTGYLGNHAADLSHAGWSAVVDSKWILGASDTEVYVLDLRSPEHGFVKRPTSGSAPPNGGQTMGAVYHPASHALLLGGVRDGDGMDARVWKLSVPPDLFSGTFTWTTISPSGGVTPKAPVNAYRGTWGKWQIIQDMGNGQSALVYATDVTGPTWVLKLPHAGL
jgi:hypothetical protein